MAEEQAAATWDAAVVDGLQAILDRSAQSATPVVGRVFAREDWRLDAAGLLERWNGPGTVSVASVSASGQPHLAAVGARFQPDGRLTMRMYEGSIRQKDVAANPRIALQKALPDGTVMTVYGTANVVADSYQPNQTTPGTAGSHEVEIGITRIYAMQPRRA
jgi:hypothetical protein